MSFAFRTRRLKGVQIAKALMLLRLVCSDLDPAAWFRFAAACEQGTDAADEPRGIVGVEDEQGYILGLFCFRVHRMAPTGPLLECDHFIVPDMVRSGVPFGELTFAAEALAREHGCERIRLSLPGVDSGAGRPGDRFLSALRENGYHLESVRFEKKVGDRAADHAPHANA